MQTQASLDRLRQLVSPFGVVSTVSQVPRLRGLDEVDGFGASAGTGIRSHGRADAGLTPKRQIHAGATAVGDPERARLVAIAEAAERYSGGDFSEPVTWATHAELSGPAIDPSSIPRCSDTELADPRCRLTAFDAGARIRWVRGTDMATGEATWVPLVMARYGMHDAAPGERFWYRISTGYAVHTDPVEAVLRGVCEVIERDAIAITWLQRLPLPTVPADTCRSETLDLLLRWSERHFLETLLFDATTDVGVPTVYCLQIAPHDPHRRQEVSAATGRDIPAAAEKAVLDVVRRRIPRPEEPEPVEDFGKFSEISDGANYMGRASMAREFDFLTDGARERAAPPRDPLPDSPADALAAVVDLLSRAGMQAVAVDRTTRELAAVGLTSVCVVVPGLQPMTLIPLAQYRAHPRLYEAPRRMGYRSLPEEELNPWPQPFA